MTSVDVMLLVNTRSLAPRSRRVYMHLNTSQKHQYICVLHSVIVCEMDTGEAVVTSVDVMLLVNTRSIGTFCRVYFLLLLLYYCHQGYETLKYYVCMYVYIRMQHKVCIYNLLLILI